jgi:hypothetical protein
MKAVKIGILKRGLDSRSDGLRVGTEIVKAGEGGRMEG